MSSPSSCKRFFDIQELVGALVSTLEREDLSRLSRTSRRMHISCIPALYKELDIRHGSRDIALFSSTTGMVALERNFQHIKNLGFGLEELVFYHNCVLAYEEFCSQTTNSPPAPRPSWLPPPDPHAEKQPVPLPPITQLSELTLRLEGSGDDHPQTLPSATDPRSVLAQVCWIVSLNPRLTRLSVHFLDVIGLVGAIAGLDEMQELCIELRGNNDHWLQLGSDVFYNCPPPSIPHPTIDMHNLDLDDDIDTLSTPHQWPPATNDTEEEEGSGGNLQQPAPRRKESLVNLMYLALNDILYGRHSTTDIFEIFGYRPRLESLVVAGFVGRNDLDVIGVYIGQHCPRLRTLHCGSYVNPEENHELVFRIMETLPTHQVEVLNYAGYYFDFENPIVNTAIQRHSASLQQFVTNVYGTSRISASVFFEQCRNLTTLHLGYGNDRYGVCSALADVIDIPSWSCTKLQSLRLALSGCQLPVEEGLQLYCARLPPITLFEAEKSHFDRMEVLYQRIGALTDLRHLDLQMVESPEVGSWADHTVVHGTAFPAMLTLGDVWMGRPGYLHHFAGLSNLETLNGTVRADTDETKRTMEWPEAVWINKHWPQLTYARFYNSQKAVRAHMKWLKDKRQFGRPELKLGPFEQR
ncbi:hypothetical protein BGX33_003416 [Mortierella sp. NVP41]|nr:hypothetical protein BGX33_003416 [Mortierella sp. NVP41]